MTSKGFPNSQATPLQNRLQACCTECGATQTPQWRRNADHLLCNACGIKQVRQQRKAQLAAARGAGGEPAGKAARCSRESSPRASPGPGPDSCPRNGGPVTPTSIVEKAAAAQVAAAAAWRAGSPSAAVQEPSQAPAPAQALAAAWEAAAQAASAAQAAPAGGPTGSRAATPFPCTIDELLDMPLDLLEMSLDLMESEPAAALPAPLDSPLAAPGTQAGAAGLSSAQACQQACQQPCQRPSRQQQQQPPAAALVQSVAGASEALESPFLCPAGSFGSSHSMPPCQVGAPCHHMVAPPKLLVLASFA